MIKNKTYTINNQLLNTGLLSSYVEMFWNDIFSPLVFKGADKYLMLMVKISFDSPKFEYAYRSLGYLRCVNHSEKELFADYLNDRMTFLNDAYTSSPLNKIHFSYIEKDGQAPEDSRRLLQDLSDVNLTFHRFNNYELPISMNIHDFDEIIATTAFETFTRYIIINSGSRTYQIDVTLDGLINRVRILGAANLTWVDTKLANDIGFIREIGKSTKYFLDGVNVLNKQIIPAKGFKRQPKDRKRDSVFVTMDLETINLNGKLVPYLINGYNGSKHITSYVTKSPKVAIQDPELYFNMQADLFSNFMDQLRSPSFVKNKVIYVYAHNLSGFDGIFLMKHLLFHGKVEPLLFNGKLKTIKLTTESGKIIIFKDSYQLLPLSLRKLCKAFNVTAPKGYFPFNLNDVFYTGVLPSFECWTGVSQSVYDGLRLEMKYKYWSFKAESIKYCKLDCQSLYEVITHFNELIFNEFSVNCHKSLTLPALAMRIYKTHFMPEESLFQLLPEVDQNIRESYTGGAVDVYIPHNRVSALSKQLKYLYYYDVNSLYPHVMSKLGMPIGKPVAFEGEIRKVESDAFGIFNCNITSPANLIHPILQRKVKGVGTVAALGNWNGWISSIEMDNAMKFGYTFEIIKGYQFERGDLFSAYVNKMYELRSHYPKGEPMNLIAKLLLNSLYGKFGLKIEKTIVDIFNLNRDADKLALKALLDKVGESIQDHIELGKYKYLFVRSSASNLFNEESYHGSDINIAVASTITAGARIHMSAFKNNPNFNLYYSDSAVIDRPLNEKFIGKELGKVKLEHTIAKAVFLAPKVYGLVDIEGNEIIKIKGVTDEITSNIKIGDLESLLILDQNKVFSQHKWYKNLMKGTININDVLYNLKVTSNKRRTIYQDNVFNSTEPLNYEEIIKSKD